MEVDPEPPLTMVDRPCFSRVMSWERSRHDGVLASASRARIQRVMGRHGYVGKQGWRALTLASKGDRCVVLSGLLVRSVLPVSLRVVLRSWMGDWIAAHLWCIVSDPSPALARGWDGERGPSNIPRVPLCRVWCVWLEASVWLLQRTDPPSRRSWRAPRVDSGVEVIHSFASSIPNHGLFPLPPVATFGFLLPGATC